MVVLPQKRLIQGEMFVAKSVIGGESGQNGWNRVKNSYLPNLMYEYAFPGFYLKRKG